MKILLDALCPLRLLDKKGDKYTLMPISEAYLVREKETYYGDFCLKTQLVWEVRSHTLEALRTGIALGGDFAKFETEMLWSQDFAPAILDWPHRAIKAKEMWETLNVNFEN